jgi:hypothetical protein
MTALALELTCTKVICCPGGEGQAMEHEQLRDRAQGYRDQAEHLRHRAGQLSNVLYQRDLERAATHLDDAADHLDLIAAALELVDDRYTVRRRPKHWI